MIDYEIIGVILVFIGMVITYYWSIPYTKALSLIEVKEEDGKYSSKYIFLVAMLVEALGFLCYEIVKDIRCSQL